MVKNKGLITEAYEWDEEEVSSDDNEMVEVKCIIEQIPSQKKRILGVDQLTEDPSSLGLKDLVFVKSLADDTKVTIPGVERPWLFEAEGFILPNHNTSRILLSESQRNTTDSSVAVTDSSTTDYDSADEFLVCSIPLPPLKKLDGAEPISGPKTLKSILRGETLQANKAEALKSTRAKSSNANRSKTPTKIGCSRHMTGVKSYVRKYMEQPEPKVLFGYDCTYTEGYGSIKCNGKLDKKADDGYLLGHLLVSKAFRVFNTRRQQTEETYHITFNESLDAIKFSKSSVHNINIAETKIYPPDEYLHPYEPSQRYQTNNNDASFIETYESPELVVLETEVSSDQNGQADQNDQSVLNDKILNDDHSEHSNHTNDEQINDNLPNTKDIQISKHLSSASIEDT
uniref:Retrovirus-related Pol polyprotein from transposon TNT 1-94 n=1 Tax=Tanacetum cinerariifolium TaxID=118510 RepID=A0A6L2MG56_TANCI|nr:retrovirus-related Pol polyprotein from transposon TNT 1-94 [Tanacetum cinerariifolium]